MKSQSRSIAWEEGKSQRNRTEWQFGFKFYSPEGQVKVNELINQNAMSATNQKVLLPMFTSIEDANCRMYPEAHKVSNG